MRPHPIRLGGAGAAVVAILSCGDSTSSRLAEPASLTLIPSVTVLDALGQTLALEVTVRDALGNPIPAAAVTFDSDDPGVVTVSASGVVTAVAPGTATVTASINNLSRSTEVSVIQVPAALVRVAGDGQTAEVTSVLPDPLVVEVQDRRNNPVAGITVSFSLGLSPGSLSAATATTGADGRAETVLTLDTVATTYRVTATASSGDAPPTSFLATGVPAAASVGVAAGGDGQRQPAGRELPSDLAVRVTDQYGNGIESATVVFSVTAGGGSLSASMVSTDRSGTAVTRWTLGATVGPQGVEADAGLGGAPIVFSATATDLAISAVTPATLVAGQAAQITGTGFDANPANDTVMVDGQRATITGATATTLDFIVPPGQCRPAQDVEVSVATALGGATDPTLHPAAPAAYVTLAVGEHVILQDPDDYCLQFAAAAANEAYLLGVQSVSSISNAVTSSRLIGETAPGAPVVVLRTAPEAASRSTGSPSLTERVQRRYRHREAELALRAQEERRVAQGISAYRVAAPRAASAIDSTVQVGDVVPIKVPTLGQDLCTNSVTINAVVKAVGQRGIWLHDPANPGGGFTDGDYLALSALLDTLIYDTDVAYFGDPTDLDRNGRIVVVITRRINDNSNNLLAFVNPSDVETASSCPASNEAEVYYGRAPDGTGASSYTRQDALEDAGALIAHEFTHIIQVGRRVVVNGQSQFMASFMAEGQATLAEEVNGHAALGNTPGQNYGYAVGFNTAQTVPESWYEVALTDISYYFGRSSGATSVAGAPEECGWMTGSPSPCGGRALWYGVTWSFLRWVNDHFGSAFAGGEQELQRALVDNTLRGLDNVANVVGVPADSLLAQWGAALYADDRITGVSPRLTMPSWDFVDIFDVNLPQSASLLPRAIDFAGWDSEMSVKAGSAAYFRIRGSNRPDVAFRVRGTADQPLPNWMQLFLVRIQ